MLQAPDKVPCADKAHWCILAGTKLVQRGVPGAPKREAAEEKSTDASSGCAADAALIAIVDASFGANTALHAIHGKQSMR